jgi:hypothetical protein
MKKHPTEEEVSLTFIGPNASMVAALEVMRSLGFLAKTSQVESGYNDNPEPASHH